MVDVAAAVVVIYVCLRNIGLTCHGSWKEKLTHTQAQNKLQEDSLVT